MSINHGMDRLQNDLRYGHANLEYRMSKNKQNIRPTQTKVGSRNLIKGINTCATSVIRYSVPFLKSTWEFLRKMDQKTKKVDNDAQGLTLER